MKNLTLTTGTDSFRAATVYTTAQCKAAPEAEVRALAPPLKSAWDEIEAADATHQAMHDAMVAAMAMRDRVDRQVDDFTRSRYREAQAVYGAGGERIKALYPEGLTALIKGPIPEQPGKMRVQATRLEADPNETLAASAELMREKATTLEEAVAAFDLAVEQVAGAWVSVLKARGEWIRINEKTYGELVILKGRKQAEGFFKKQSKRRKKKATA